MIGNGNTELPKKAVPTPCMTQAQVRTQRLQSSALYFPKGKCEVVFTFQDQEECPDPLCLEQKRSLYMTY